MWQTIMHSSSPTTSPPKNTEKKALVVWPHLQTQQHRQGVVAKHGRREEKTMKVWKDVGGLHEKLGKDIR